VNDHEITCEELVELVTEYLEGGLTDAQAERFEDHIGACEGCSNYLAQIRTTIELAGRVTVDDLAAATKTELLAAFRGWRRE
jgi:anti-sigma factor RsiW